MSNQSIVRLCLAPAISLALLVAYDAWPEIREALGLDPRGRLAEGLEPALGTLFWFSLAYATNAALKHVVWDGVILRRSGVSAPKLLIQLVGFAIWVTALVIVLAFVFDVPVTGFLTTSGIIIAVIGFALRNLIADVFTGIAMGFEHPFRVGDWIQFEGEEPARVLEVNWRTTRLLTMSEIAIIVPNSKLATNDFRNYNAPESFWRDSFEIVLPYDVTAHQAERILLSAVAQVPESIKLPRQPDVRIAEYTERGAKWQLRFWVPDVQLGQELKFQVQRNVLRNLHFAGIEVPRINLNLLNANDPMAKRDAEQEGVEFLHDITPLAPLNDDELSELSQVMRRRLCLMEQPVVRQGDEGASLFVVKEGMLEVSITDEQGVETVVGRLTPGMFFGEMSLLTGAPRSASVVPTVDSIVYEITRDDLEPLLQRREEIAVQLSEVLAERQMRNLRLMSEKSDRDTDETRVSLARQFLAGIQTFFGLGRHHQAQARSAGD